MSILFIQICLNEEMLPKYVHIYSWGPLVKWVECLPMAREIGVQSKVKSYQKMVLNIQHNKVGIKGKVE